MDGIGSVVNSYRPSEVSSESILGCMLMFGDTSGERMATHNLHNSCTLLEVLILVQI